MANFTRRAIMETFISLLEERPLSKITVKDIVDTCGINRNTFYYHFHDIPELVEVIVKEEAQAIIQKYPSVNSIVDCFDALIEFASHRKRTIMHIFRSVNREMFEQNLMEISEYFVKNYIDTALAQETISQEDKKSIIDYYKCVCFGLIIDWLNHGMTEEYAQSIRRIILLKKDYTIEMARSLQKQIS
ncbi:MAG: TetR/AcrR family transcriptional regulator [Lachnospiraceae bacterium]